MSDTECEIEYLDEYADIVQKCAQPENSDESRPVLVKKYTNKRRSKRKNYSDDSDYNPETDQARTQGTKRKKLANYSEQNVAKASYTGQNVAKASYTGQNMAKASYTGQNVAKASSQASVPEKVIKTNIVGKEVILKPKKKRSLIKLPDYLDPLCLPVKMSSQDAIDVKRRTYWNNICMEYFKRLDMDMKPVIGTVLKSKKTVVFRNVRNKVANKIETTMWSKLQVLTDKKEVKAEVSQGILPRFKERHQLNYRLAPFQPVKVKRKVFELILSKDNVDKEDTLIVYRPQENEASYFKLLQNSLDEEEPSLIATDELGNRPAAKEMALFKICAPCYQASWRPSANDDKKCQCDICKRNFTSLYNLLTHLKIHSAEDIRQHQKQISITLAGIVDYHYTCRICRIKNPSVKKLRKHLISSHRSREPFVCDIGGHIAK